MRHVLFVMGLTLILLCQAAPAEADCAGCVVRAEQFWGVVHAQVTSTTPAMALYLARHELAHGHATAPNYYLTADCGMRPEELRSTLDIAKSLDVHMTIFLMGLMIDRWPDQSRALLRRVVAEGHELALHSYDHKSFVGMSREQIYDEVVRNWALVDWALGYHYPMRFIRMPYGARNDTVFADVGALGVQSVFWDIDTFGWRDWATVPIVEQQVVSKMRPGAIVVFHCSSAADRSALPLYVQSLREVGYEPRLLSTMQAKPSEAEVEAYWRSPHAVRTAAAVGPKTSRDPPGLRRALAMLDADGAVVE